MRRLLAWAGVYSASAALQKLTGFVILLWLARAMPVEDYATFGLFYALQTGIITFALAGVVEAIVGSLKAHALPEERAALYAAGFRASVVMTCLTCVLAIAGFALSAGGRSVSLSSLLWVIASSVLLAGASYQAHIGRLEERHARAVLFNTLPPLAGFLGGLTAYVMQRRVESFFAGSAIAVSLVLAALAVQKRQRRSAAAGVSDEWRLLAAGGPFAAVAFLGWFSGYGQNYIVNFMFSPLEVARFTFIMTLASVMQLVATALNQVWSPRFYQITHDTAFDEVERRNRLFFRYQGIALGALAGTMLAGVDLAQRYLGGHLAEYGSMRFELGALTCGYVLLPPWWHCQNYFLAYGKGPELMRNAIATSAIGIVLWVLLMWRLGPTGIYVGFVVQMFVRMQGAVVLARRHWPVRLAWEGVAAGLLLTAAGALLSGF